MTTTVEVTLYKFDELGDVAKDKARQWWRDCIARDSDTSWVFEYVATCAEILGIDLRTRPAKLYGGGTRMEPCIFYSGFWSQGDGACFEGSYRYAKGANKKIRQRAPQDVELHRIADVLLTMQKHSRYDLTAQMKHRGYYYHSGCMSIDVEGSGAEMYEDALAQTMRDFADWIYKRLEEEYNFANSSEQVDESLRANDYDFKENGSIY